MGRTASLLLLVPVLGAVLVGCGDDDTESGGGEEAPVQVVAAFYPLAEAAARVGGERVEVTNLTPPGAEPHDLELTPDQVDAILDADLALVMGNGFQPALEEAAGQREGITVELLGRLPIDAAGKVVAEEAEAAEAAEGDDLGALDPHVWLDPVLMGELAGEVEAALREVDPEGADVYAANAEEYRAVIGGVHDDFEARLAACERDLLVTAHDAFGWLAQRYGLRQEGIAGISPDAEPSPERVADLADLVEAEGVTTVFTERLVSPETAETLAREAGVETAVLDPLEGLSDDDLAAGADWASVMRANLDEIAGALGCS